jgi:hypothetical protein
MQETGLLGKFFRNRESAGFDAGFHMPGEVALAGGFRYNSHEQI